MPDKKGTNRTIRVEAVDLNENGDGIAHVEGEPVVFVRGLLPGEVADVRIVRSCRSYLVGKIARIVKYSESRVKPSYCPGFERGCGGCTSCHLYYNASLSIKEKHVIDCLERIGHLDLSGVQIDHLVGDNKSEVQAMPVFTGRNKMTYPFYEDGGKVRLGFYKTMSHEAVSIDGCLIEKPEICELRHLIESKATELGLSVYEESKNGEKTIKPTTESGLLRHLMVRISEFSGEIMLVLIVSRKPSNAEQAKLAVLYADLQNFHVASMWLCINGSDGNVILDGELKHIFGTKTITNAIGDCKFEISPKSFYQVNSNGAKVLYDTAYEFAGLEAQTEDRIINLLDLYCGTGTIGIYFAHKFASKRPAKQFNDCSTNKSFDKEATVCCDTRLKLVGVEIVDDAVKNARRNAELNGIKNAEFITADASIGAKEALSGKILPDIIVVDPPRKGCDAETLKLLIESNAKRIVYVSCGPATLARDLEILTKNHFTIERIRTVDMFPMTGHVETVVLLTNKTNGV